MCVYYVTIVLPTLGYLRRETGVYVLGEGAIRRVWTNKNND